MAYERLHWVESETPLSADNMNNIEDGIEELQSQKVDKVSGKALSDNNYTTAEKTKLAGIEAGAEVNPGNATTSAAGLMSASDKTKLDGVQAGAQVNRTYTAVTGKPTAAASPAFGGTVTVSQVSQSATGQVSVTDRTITIPSNDATTSAHGLMSAADKTKLNGIAAGAEVNQNAFSEILVNGSLISADAKTDHFQVIASNGLEVSSLGDSLMINGKTVTTSANGVMKYADKVKLDSIEVGAQVNPGNATISTAGLMSASDKTKLNGITSGATRTSVISHSVDNIVVGATGYKDVSETFTSSSGEIRGVVGFKMGNASSSGANYHSVCVNSIYVAGKTLYASLYNPSGSVARVKLTAYIIKDV